jgi:alpha-D-xyloside xylohydrolase
VPAWDIAVPSRSGLPAGVTMAGFSGREDDLVEVGIVPRPAVMVMFNLGDVPLVVDRPMVLEFPDDPACAVLDRQYMLGGDLLVAPVFQEGGEVDYYVPEGTWTHLLSGETVTGPGWRRRLRQPAAAGPAGSGTATGARDDRPDYGWADRVTLRPYPRPDGGETGACVSDQHGRTAAEFTVRREGDRVRITARGNGGSGPRAWRVLPVGEQSAVPEQGGAQVEHTADGILVRAAVGTESLTLACRAGHCGYVGISRSPISVTSGRRHGGP